MIQADTNVQALPDFIKLWNFGNPSETEKKFREILSRAEMSHDISYHAQLLTQIARTQSLQAKFEQAHAILDTVEKMLTPDLKLAKVRYLLERGRTFNSSDHQDKALPLFMEAYQLAESISNNYLAIDAVHMVAIAEPDKEKQIQWNLKGIAMADADPKSKVWVQALYNNIGECYLAVKDYDSAYLYFHKLAEFDKERFGKADKYTLKDQAKALRLGGHPDKSLAIIEPVFVKLDSDKNDDGYIREELAESLYASGNLAKSKPHFKKAYELLLEDEWYKKNGDLKRLKELGE
jgi:tetratricopeptide (TPR) repeat protein